MASTSLRCDTFADRPYGWIFGQKHADMTLDPFDHNEDVMIGVRAGDGDCHGPDGAAAVIVEHPDVVGENQRLVLGQEIEIVVDVAERPFQLARAVAVALNLRTHRGLEMSER